MHATARRKHYDDSIAYGLRILASDPTRETVQRLIMLLYVLNGQRAEAIRQFDRFAKALREECDVSPMPQTRAVLSAIRSEDIFRQLPNLIETELARPISDLIPHGSFWLTAADHRSYAGHDAGHSASR